MTDGETRFWAASTPLLEQDGITRSTMMGLPCLRIRGKFFAACDRASGDLLVKLPADRVYQLIADGRGREVAPAGRRFREWVAIPADAGDAWSAYLDDACAFVAGAAET